MNNKTKIEILVCMCIVLREFFLKLSFEQIYQATYIANQYTAVTSRKNLRFSQ